MSTYYRHFRRFCAYVLRVSLLLHDLPVMLLIPTIIRLKTPMFRKHHCEFLTVLFLVLLFLLHHLLNFHPGKIKHLIFAFVLMLIINFCHVLTYNFINMSVFFNDDTEHRTTIYPVTNLHQRLDANGLHLLLLCFLLSFCSPIMN